MDTPKFVLGPVGFGHVAPAPLGSVMVQDTAPLGRTAFATPLTVVVKVVTPPSVGAAEAVNKIVGNCFTIDKLKGVLDAPT